MQLEINGKQRKLQWGTGALEDLCDRLDMSLQDIDVAIITNENKVLNQLAYSALRNGADINDEEIEFNYKFFLAWLDEQPEGIGTEIMTDFLNSKILGRTMQERFNEIIERLDVADAKIGSPKTAKKKSTP